MQHLTSTRKLVSETFSRSLQELLTEKYGYLPSAAKFSDAFNLRAHGTTTISRETARKWLRGEAIPELSRLRVLIMWLGLKPADFLDPALTNPYVEERTEQIPGISTRGHIHNKLLSLLNELDEKSIEALFLAAWALRGLKNSKSNDMDYTPLSRFPE